MDPDPPRDLDRSFSKRAESPFGDLHLAAGGTLRPFSVAGQIAAPNLLVKAV